MLASLALPALAQGDDACLKCHADRAALVEARTDAARPLEPLLLDGKAYARSVHGARGCGECHFDYDAHPHPKDAETARCSECHEETAKVFGASVHGKPAAKTVCRDCHGVHDTLKASERDARLFPLNVHRTCGACHSAEKYAGDEHGHAIWHKGLSVSATCVSCHGHHDMRAVGDPQSRVSRKRVDEVCAQCHVGIFEQYRRSIHHLRSLEDDDHKGAICVDCHRPHAIGNGRNFRAESIRACARCHDQRSGTFRQTYHGKLSALGYGDKVAACTDCHDHHAILPASDPGSRIHPQNLVATCGSCHNDAHEGFVGYRVHADPHDAENYAGLNLLYKVMVGLLVGVFSLAGLHAALWLTRSLLAREWRRPAPEGPFVRRWRPFYTTLHVAMMVSFLTVALTGLPIHYAHRPWAATVMRLLGGPSIAGFLHRVGAVLMMATIAAYLGHIVHRAIKGEKGLWSGPNTMIPRWKDFQDCWGNLKWFFGRGPKPRFDRWTYWEKFDFWAVFWGIVVIGGSGLVLWFPEAFTRVLPGWVINAAVVIHGHEAVLAVGFIFTIHIFHTQFRPEKFPMDILFFTGRITEEELRRERPLEYERALREGTLGTMRAAPARRRTRRRGYILGTAALVLGLFFVLVMVVAWLG